MKKPPKTPILSDTNQKEDVAIPEVCNWCRKPKPCICGRPSKIGKFTEALEKTLNEGMNAFVLNDEELIILVNEQLPEEDKVSEVTFSTWKTEGIKDETCQVFRSLYKRALIKQKINLFARLNDPLLSNTWQRYAWQIERKFDEWNLKHKGANEDSLTVKDDRGKTIEDLLREAREAREAAAEVDE